MLAPTEPRCAGFAPDTQHDTCPRRFQCARFISRCGPQSPMAWSACEGGDSFIHAESIAQADRPGHPADAPPVRVLAVQPATPPRS